MGGTTVVASYSSSLQIGLMGYYNCDDTSGTTLLNSVSGGSNATTTGTVNDADSKLGKSVYLDGSGQYIRIPNSGNVTLYNKREYTVSLWVKMHTLASVEGHRVILICTRNSSGTNAMMLRIATDNYTFLYTRSSSDAEKTTDGQITAISNTGVWYHLLATSELGYSSQIWINGVNRSASYAMIVDGDTYNPANDDYWYLGVSNYTGSTYNADARFDEIGIWDRKLSDAEIAAIYNSGTGLTYPFV